jgi:hypothetical protein
MVPNFAIIGSTLGIMIHSLVNVVIGFTLTLASDFKYLITSFTVSRRS